LFLPEIFDKKVSGPLSFKFTYFPVAIRKVFHHLTNPEFAKNKPFKILKIE